MFDGKTILITGGTGSLGRALTKKLLDLKLLVLMKRYWKELFSKVLG